MLDLPDERWDDIRIFLAAYRHKSLGRAASRLGLDTSTVSRRIAGLEEALGVRLFERTREGLLHTRTAERVLPAAEAMEGARHRLARDVSDVESVAEGTVRLSVAPGMADTVVAPLLVGLRRQHPRITIELDASVAPRDLTRHEADLALRSVQAKGADLVATKLGSGPWIPVASRQLVKKLKRVKSWNDCPWIAWDRDLASLPAARWVAQHAGKADVVLRTSQFTAQLIAAESSLGIALVPVFYTGLRDLEPVHHDPVLEPSITALPSDDLWLVGHRVLRDVPRVAAVWSYLADEVRALARRRRS
jgi:DNA-binding transcriptional LysR family regulator